MDDLNCSKMANSSSLSTGFLEGPGSGCGVVGFFGLGSGVGSFVLEESFFLLLSFGGTERMLLFLAFDEDDDDEDEG